ncbi:nif-specific transcriptional activator NifA [Candidatus Albibeggiatoa sp. nov. NOAA]|uniref:nif-specific transcriptional activator NifA n=1 Tax=Candidatus Albibeggiatoa sp. nov. NOAA TaxID=3162724 RepID=UPI003304B8E3|nr:nif-specific transcriptional activator NifA [Thiotrichaceae bacterium]
MQTRSELIECELEALFEVGKVLNRSADLQTALEGVLQKLHQYAQMQYGVVTLLRESGELMVNAAYAGGKLPPGAIKYQTGEGIIGSVMEEQSTIIIERAGQDSRFIGKLGLYELHLPFIGVPIYIDKQMIGVLAAQPSEYDEYLHERARFLEMVAQFIGQTVHFMWELEKERQDLTDERDHLRRTVRSHFGFDNIIGHSPAMQKVFEMVRQVSKWGTTVLIRGESGTGKELIANAVHYNSPRHNGSFIKLNCAALPENLLESELFGHEKGAFSGAVTQRKGRFERADGGTLFLDEIGEISPTFQAKLLRVLQEGEFERVGGTRTLKVDVRIITATNVNLEEAVERGDFREDLYYRLNVMPINLPPLNERSEDIPELSTFLVDKVAKAQGRKLQLTDSAIRLLMRHNWPGNVRELENCLERAAIMSENGVIDRSAISLTGVEEKIPVTREYQGVDLNDENLDERERVIAALEQAGWVQAKAARLLNMTPRQIAYRIQTLDIKLRSI